MAQRRVPADAGADHAADARADRGRALVLGAFRLIAERGFEGLRLRDVASAAGIDHSTLHHYFPTKQDLVAAVVGYAVDEFRERAGVQEGPGAAGRMRVHLHRLAGELRARPELYLVLREMDLRATRDPAVRAMLEQRERGWRAALAARFRDAGGPVDPERAAELVVAAAKGASFAPAAGAGALELLADLLCPEPAGHAA